MSKPSASWPPEIGEAVGLARAAAALERFDDRIRSAGRQAIRTVHELEPGVKATGRVSRPGEISGVVRSDTMPGISVGYVTWLGRSGSVSVASLVLTWAGDVQAVGIPAARPSSATDTRTPGRQDGK